MSTTKNYPYLYTAFHPKKGCTNMKILVCLAALFILSTAAPGTWEDDPRYRASLAMIYGPYAETAARGRSVSGASACDSQTLKANDVISQKFMKDHICLFRNSPPIDFTAFCRDFRKGRPIYQVMLLSTDDMKQLHNDLKGHQMDFYNDRNLFRPRTSKVHYTTDQPYTFIYCEQKQEKWIGCQKTGCYQQYVPKGTAGNPQGVYQIYHGCPPVTSRPGFRQNGSC